MLALVSMRRRPLRNSWGFSSGHGGREFEFKEDAWSWIVAMAHVDLPRLPSSSRNAHWPLSWLLSNVHHISAEGKHAEFQVFFFFFCLNWRVPGKHFCDWPRRCREGFFYFTFFCKLHRPEKHQRKCQHRHEEKEKKTCCSFREGGRTGAERSSEAILTVCVSVCGCRSTSQSMPLPEQAICSPCWKGTAGFKCVQSQMLMPVEEEEWGVKMVKVARQKWKCHPANSQNTVAGGCGDICPLSLIRRCPALKEKKSCCASGVSVSVTQGRAGRMQAVSRPP